MSFIEVYYEAIIGICIVLSVAAVVNVVVAFVRNTRRKRDRELLPSTCYLCNEREPSVRLWGYHVCTSCQMLYDALLYYTVVENNEHARKALGRAAVKLKKLSVITVTSAWQEEEE